MHTSRTRAINAFTSFSWSLCDDHSIASRGFANCCLQKKYNMHGWNVQILLPSFYYFARSSCYSASLNYGLKQGSKFSFFKQILLTLTHTHIFFNEIFIERSVTVRNTLK